MITKLLTDLNNIQTLDAEPNDVQGLTFQQLQAKFDKAGNDIKTYINSGLSVEIDSLNSENIKNSGVQTINGVKTFAESPIVPTPTTDYQSSPKKYVDNLDALQRQYVDGTFTTKSDTQSIVLGQIPNGSLTDDKLSNDVGQIKERFTSSLADMSSQVSGKGASLIGLNDSGNKFTATNVEGAILELFTSANNGDAVIKTAIVGKGGTVLDANSDGINTRQELADGVNTIKRGQGTAVESNVQTGKTFANADGILRTGNHVEPTIASLGGKRWATGSTTGGASSFTVSGLSFQPKYFMGMYLGSNPKGIPGFIHMDNVNSLKALSISSEMSVGEWSVTITANSFSITGTTLFNGYTLQWFATE